MAAALADIEPVHAVAALEGGLLEAPRPLADGSLLYSDITSGGVHRIAPDGSIETLLERRRGIGGMVPHADGGVVVTGRDVRHIRPGAEDRVVLGDVDGVAGYNDMATLPDGRILVGALRFRPMAGEEPVPGEVGHLDGNGAAGILCGGILWPNGIGHSPDGTTVYVNDFATGIVHAVPAAGGDPVEFARSPRGSADGLAVDREGGVWIALGPGAGVARFDPGGRLDGIVDVPSAFVSSLAFGGPDGRDVAITTGEGALFSARSEIPGLALSPATI